MPNDTTVGQMTSRHDFMAKTVTKILMFNLLIVKCQTLSNEQMGGGIIPPNITKKRSVGYTKTERQLTFRRQQSKCF